MPTFTAHTAIGQREDLIDVIYDISPTETPILSTLARTKATAVFHEWQTDILAAATAANAAVEGADPSAATISPTVRLGNYCQIVQKTIQVSNTLEAVNKAGRKSEKAYQLSRASQELKRDMETIITANQGRDAGSASAARKLGSILSWLKTNTSAGTSGTDPTTIGVSTRSDGATRTFTETLLKTVVAEAFDSGGNPKLLVVGSGLKQKASSFAGIADQRYNAPANAPTTILAAADVYLSDFGQLAITPDRFMRTRDALLLDPEYAAVAYLRPFATNELARTGDSEKTQLIAEFTLEMRNEAAHAIVADLNPAL
jgi:hypothetical protein